MIQQNVITSTTQPIESHKARIRAHNTIFAIIVILGITLILSLYVYQASALYAVNLSIKHSEYEYARQQRLNAEALTMLAQTQSMETMVERVKSAGYTQPTAEQIKYVKLSGPSNHYLKVSEATTP